MFIILLIIVIIVYIIRVFKKRIEKNILKQINERQTNQMSFRTSDELIEEIYSEPEENNKYYDIIDETEEYDDVQNPHQYLEIHN